MTSEAKSVKSERQNKKTGKKNPPRAKITLFTYCVTEEAVINIYILKTQSISANSDL